MEVIMAFRSLAIFLSLCFLAGVLRTVAWSIWSIPDDSSVTMFWAINAAMIGSPLILLFKLLFKGSKEGAPEPEE